MKKILSILFAFAIVSVANAIVTQKVILRDGSVLYGYIQKQDGKGRLTIHTDSALVCQSGSKVSEIIPVRVSEEELSPVWKAWAEYHNAYEEANEKKQLPLSKVSFKKDAVINPPTANVMVLEEGEILKYVEMTSNVYNIQWKDVLTIEADQRPSTALSGIDRAYKLKDGKKIVGQYAGESEHLLKLYVGRNKVRSVKINDVVKYEYVALNPNQDIFAQSELLDVVKLHSGREIKGIIVEQSYESSKDSENYLKIRTGKSPADTEEVKLSEIQEVRKEDNTGFALQTDITIVDEDVFVNRQKAESIGVSRSREKKGFELELPFFNDSIQIVTDSTGKAKVTVEYRVQNDESSKKFQVVRLSSMQRKRMPVYGFTFEELSNSFLYSSTEPVTSVNGTTSVEFVIPDTGDYALYDKQSNLAYTFVVKEEERKP